jgi:hypothetical protein
LQPGRLPIGGPTERRSHAFQPARESLGRHRGGLGIGRAFISGLFGGLRFQPSLSRKLGPLRGNAQPFFVVGAECFTGHSKTNVGLLAIVDRQRIGADWCRGCHRRVVSPSPGANKRNRVSARELTDIPLPFVARRLILRGVRFRSSKSPARRGGRGWHLSERKAPGSDSCC